MSAVSSESPLAAADLSVPSTTPSSSGNGLQTEPTDQGAPPANADFGPNEWLVDELYQRYLADPGSVDRAWWSFFADYRPVRSTDFVTGAVLDKGNAGMIGVEIMRFDVGGLINRGEAGGLARVHQIERHFGLAVDHHGLAG